MEALEGFEHRYQYAIVGHSGDAAQIPFVDFGKPPRDRKERLQVLSPPTLHPCHLFHNLLAISLAVLLPTRGHGASLFRPRLLLCASFDLTSPTLVVPVFRTVSTASASAEDGGPLAVLLER